MALLCVLGVEAGVACGYVLEWSFFPALSPHTAPTPSPSTPKHISLHAHWRLPLMHLLQIFATVPCNLSVKRNQIRLVHSGSIFKFSVNFWQMLSVLYWTPCDLNLTQLLGGSVKICSVFLKLPCYLWLMPHTRKNNMVIIVSFKFYWREKDAIKGKLFSTHVYILNILLVF